ncbi:MAG: hypothetical protein MPW13_15135 [Candidatus Manganitrophus sp.]|nr:hypothetical protein [Candidatus Manganitrophus sp.]
MEEVGVEGIWGRLEGGWDRKGLKFEGMDKRGGGEVLGGKGMMGLMGKILERDFNGGMFERKKVGMKIGNGGEWGGGVGGGKKGGGKRGGCEEGERRGGKKYVGKGWEMYGGGWG